MKQNQNFVEKVVDTENIFKTQLELKVKKTKLSIGRENAGDQVMIGFSFASDWLSEWWRFSGPIHRTFLSSKTKTIPVCFRHSTENCGISSTREFKKTTTATIASPNERFTEQNNSCARAL